MNFSIYSSHKSSRFNWDINNKKCILIWLYHYIFLPSRKIFSGQKINLPDSSAKTDTFQKTTTSQAKPDSYTIKKGDTLETKYAYVTHSELNAILNYKNGSLEGSRIYVTLFPCNECAKAIIQAGIKTVIYAENKYDGTPSVEASKRLMNAAGVRYYQYQPTGKKLEIYV